MIGIFDGLSISASGMRAQRIKMNAIASNIANVDTLESSDGGAYKRKHVNLASSKGRGFEEIFTTKLEKNTTSSAHFAQTFSDTYAMGIGEGVKVQSISEQGKYVSVYDPSSPYADSDGYVKKPDINPIEEMVAMMETQRAFEANATSFSSVKAMMRKSLELI